MMYRIGLDIGITSVGWSAFECDENGEPTRILDLGVRMFDGAENPKTGASLATPRRQARALRRRLRRRAHRLERVRMLCSQYFGADVLERAESNRDDIFRLRYAGLSDRLKDEELTRILIYFVKHRGYRSNRKSERKESETKKLLSALNLSREYMTENKYRTIGEMIFKNSNYFDIVDGRKIYKTRNKNEDYSKTFYREDLKNELECILDKQIEEGLINKEFKEKYLDIFLSQRSYDEGPAAPSQYRLDGYAVGNCTFEKEELRAPKSSYTFEYFNALVKINNVKIINSGEERFLSDDERKRLYKSVCTKKELNFLQVKKMLALPQECAFNLITYSTKDNKSAEVIEKNTKLFKMHKSYEIRSILTEENKNNVELIDKIAEILSNYKSDERRAGKIVESKECGTLSDGEIEKLLELNASKFGNLSIKAMRKIIPFLESGLKYDKACEAAGYDFRVHGNGYEKLRKLRGAEINEIINCIAVPVVRRAVSQTIKVINAIIDKYGSPCAVNVELARELSKNFEERKKITQENNSKEVDYQRQLNRLREEYRVLDPKGIDVLKLRLYEEQGGKCAYSLKPFEIDRLFEGNYVQIDHIIPYSRSFDDSYNNKVLVLTQENQNKGNKTPYEYFGNSAKRWQDFDNFVSSHYSRHSLLKKKKNLLCRSFTTENEKEWKERALNDTKYISRLVYNLIHDYLYLEKLIGRKKQVIAVNGRITAYLRKFWGLTKIRENGDKHHALDAGVIACVSDGTIQKITKFNHIKERSAVWDRDRKQYIFADGDGLILTKEEYDDRYGYEKKPYSGFRDELLFRLLNNPQAEMFSHSVLLQSLDYSYEDMDNIMPVFVSRMPNRKAHGPIHKETISSARSLDKGVSASKVPLTALKLSNDKSEIKDYDEKAKRDDKLLYNALYTRLLEFGGDAKKAFAEPFYKPVKDGKQGNPVKKVWVNEVFNAGMRLEERNAVADNGGMVKIDVFAKDKKYFCVPVYIKDIYAKRLPCRAITAGKKYEEWTKIDESYDFLFALYSNDLIYVESNKEFNLSSSNKYEKHKISIDQGFFYYKGIDISTGAAVIINHDNSFEGKIGLKTLLKLQKYTVDVLGNIHLVAKEKRLHIEWDS